MCLIIRCDKNLPISRELLKNFHQQNDDGWGMMWLQDNQIKTLKSHESKFEPLWEAYQRLKIWNPVIHVRYRTHGKVDHDNTHPFYCGYGIYMMHNGVVGVECNNNEKSDTWHMVENYIKPLFARSKNPHKMIRHPEFILKFSKMLGPSNRVVFGDRGGFVFYNLPIWHKIENAATGCKGMLVSNTYAWNAFTFGKNYGTYSGQTTPIVGSITSTSSTCVLLKPETNQWDMPMFHVIGSIYEDEWHNKWVKAPNGEFIWSEALNAQDEEDNNYITMNMGVAKTQDEIKSDEPENILTVEEDESGYLGILLKKFACATRNELSKLVAMEPADAVNLLHYFLHA